MADLPPAVREAFASDFPSGIAEVGGDFAGRDMIEFKPRARFVQGVGRGPRWMMLYEQGGFTTHWHTRQVFVSEDAASGVPGADLPAFAEARTPAGFCHAAAAWLRPAAPRRHQAGSGVNAPPSRRRRAGLHTST